MLTLVFVIVCSVTDSGAVKAPRYWMPPWRATAGPPCPLAEHTFFQLPYYTVFNTGRLAGWVVTGWLFQKTRRPRLSVESRGIADHCPPIDFAFVAETFADTLLCVPGHTEDTLQIKVDIGHRNMESCVQTYFG